MQALVVSHLLSFVLATQARVLQPHHRMPQKSTQAAPRKVKPSFPTIELYAVNLNERLHFRPVDDKGRPRKNADAELTRFLRCWHTGKQHRVDARLGQVLYAMGRHFQGHRIEIFSGFRPRKYCNREHSRHLTASAIDFRIAGVKNEALIAWLRTTFHPAGVGYYPNGLHVHLDVDRVQDTYWIDAGDAADPAAKRPMAAIGDTAPEAIDESADEQVRLPSNFVETFEPPADDPGLPE
jgi:uncharacterized protein YcbK (DUF882 family)